MADRSYVERLDPTRTIRLHSYEECVADKRAFGKNFTRIETLSNLMEPDETLVEGVGDRYAVITPPNATLTTEELDHFVRSAVRAGAAPPLPRSWRHSGLGDD